MKGRIGAVLASVAIAAVVLLAPSPAAAEGQLGDPVATQVGTFGRIAYVQYDGILEGQTSTGAYRVPYRITAPATPVRELGARAARALPAGRPLGQASHATAAEYPPQDI